MIGTVGQYVGYNKGDKHRLLDSGRALTPLSASGAPLVGLDSLLLPPAALNPLQRLRADYLDRWGHVGSYHAEPPKRMSLTSPLIRGLWGPTGSGKTAAALCVAESLGLPVVILQGAGLRRSMLGETERLLREAFLEIQRLGPVLLLLENIELILPRTVDRQDQRAYWQRTRLRRILFDSLDELAVFPVIILITSLKNPPKNDIFKSTPFDEVDSALLTEYLPFDHRIILTRDVPSWDLLAFLLRGRTDESWLNSDPLAVPKMSPAEVTSLVSEAAIVKCWRRVSGLEGEDEDERFKREDIERALENMRLSSKNE